MALVRGTPQLLVETDAYGGLGFESRDGRTVAVVTRDNHAAEHAAIGNPGWKCGLPFIIFAGDGGSNGLIFTGAASGSFQVVSASDGQTLFRRSFMPTFLLTRRTLAVLRAGITGR